MLPLVSPVKIFFFGKNIQTLGLKLIRLTLFCAMYNLMGLNKFFSETPNGLFFSQGLEGGQESKCFILFISLVLH